MVERSSQVFTIHCVAFYQTSCFCLYVTTTLLAARCTFWFCLFIARVSCFLRDAWLNLPDVTVLQMQESNCCLSSLLNKAIYSASLIIPTPAPILKFSWSRGPVACFSSLHPCINLIFCSLARTFIVPLSFDLFFIFFCGVYVHQRCLFCLLLLEKG